MKTRPRIVVDESHTAAGQTLQEMCVFLDEKVLQYITILERVTTEAVKAGHTNTRYQDYTQMVSGLRGQFGRMGAMLKTTTDQYVAEIEAADGYLYKGE